MAINNDSDWHILPGLLLSFVVHICKFPGKNRMYLHLEPESLLPEIAHEPIRMVVIVDAEVSSGWHSLVSDWIVRSGCLYMMAWGNIEKYGAEPIPDDGFVTTTWHSGAIGGGFLVFQERRWQFGRRYTAHDTSPHSTVGNRDQTIKVYEAA
jgi:hypothetical protein